MKRDRSPPTAGERRGGTLAAEAIHEKHGRIIETVLSLCEEVRSVVRPQMGSARAKDVGKRGASGDTTFGIDEVAEGRIRSLLEGLEGVAFYTEDAGLSAAQGAQYLLVIDPIDGTRPAAAGLESCCVSVAVAALDGRHPLELTLGDVFFGVVREIKNDARFQAARGAGARIELDGREVPASLSRNTDLSRIFWTAGYRGRPAGVLTTVISELIDLSSVDGGYFDLGSATFSITRVVKGDMDVYVDPGQRIVEDVPRTRDMFLELGHGNLLNNYPYDLAAAALIAAEAGAVVTDARGESLDGRPLIPSGGGGQLSSLVSASGKLHDAVLEKLDSGVRRLADEMGSGGRPSGGPPRAGD